MPDYTITYTSKEAGQQTTAATYIHAPSDAEAEAIKDLLTGFTVTNCINGVNAQDARQDGDGSAVIDCYEARANFRCEDGTTSFVHLPYIQKAKTAEDFEAVMLGLDLTNSDGSKLAEMVTFDVVNRINHTGL